MTLQRLAVMAEALDEQLAARRRARIERRRLLVAGGAAEDDGGFVGNACDADAPTAPCDSTMDASLAERRRRRRQARQREPTLDPPAEEATAGSSAARAPERVLHIDAARTPTEPHRLPSPADAGRRPTAFEAPCAQLARYAVLRTLGRGTFGVASLVRDERDGRLSVLKRIDCESLEEANDALAEAAALASVRSARVLSLREHLLEYDEREGVLCVCILTDFCAGGDLAARIQAARAARARFSERVLLVWVAQLCVGLADIHAADMIHRDLKPANVLLLARARERLAADARGQLVDDEPCGGLKIGDLGVASLRGSAGATTVVGSPAYMAPEVAAAGGGYDWRADMWSLGVLLVELATTRRPRLHAEHARALPAAVRECARSVELVGYSAQLAALGRDLLCIAPAGRPDALSAAARAREILSHAGWAREADELAVEAAGRARGAQPASGVRGGKGGGGVDGLARSSSRAQGGAVAAQPLARMSTARAPLSRAERVALPAGEQIHLEVSCTCQPWPQVWSRPLRGRLVLTSSLLIFYPADDERGSGARRAAEFGLGLGGEPCALPLDEIVEMSVASLGEEAGDGGAIRMRAADGCEVALGSILSCTAVQLAVSERIHALGAARGPPSPPIAHGPAGGLRRIPTRPVRSASAGAPPSPPDGKLSDVVELGMLGIARAGADAAEGCVVM